MLPIRKGRFLVLLLFLVINPVKFINAAELRSSHETVRHLGMGGVRVLSSDDAMAFAINPAYLGYNAGLNLKFFDGGLGFNGLQAFNSFSEVDWSGGLSSLSGIYGKPLWVGGQGLAAISMGRVGLYFNRQYDLTVMLRDPVMPVLDAAYFEDEFYHLGYGNTLPNGVAWGFSIKKVVRTGGTTTVGTTTLTDPAFADNIQQNLTSQLSARGEGIGFDIGIAYQLPAPFHPTLSIGYQDVGGTRIRAYDANQPMADLSENLILGATFHQDLPLLGIAGGLEYRHANDKAEVLGKKLHLGMELQFLMFDFRAGLYQGYPSYGLGLSFWLFQLDLVSFSKEMGVYPGQTPQDRLMLALNMDLSFDPDFRLLDKKGEKRRLKKRR